MGTRKRILCSDWLVVRVHKVRNFWTMSAMESQKVAEDSQNNKNICDSRWSVVLQAQFALSEQMSDQNNFLKEEMLLSLV